MGFTEEIFRRATIRGVADYLLYGYESDKEVKDYETRLSEIYLKYEKLAKQFAGEKQSEIFDLANEVTDEVADIYTEIGLQTGILLMQDIIHNMGRNNEEDIIDYQEMYDSLFKEVTKAIKLLQGLENDRVKCAVEILISAQRRTEEIYINSENIGRDET